MALKFELLVRPEGRSGPLQKNTYSGTELLDVCDRALRVNLRILVQNISPYRHVLRLDGRNYEILNISKH